MDKKIYIGGNVKQKSSRSYVERDQGKRVERDQGDRVERVERNDRFDKNAVKEYTREEITEMLADFIEVKPYEICEETIIGKTRMRYLDDVKFKAGGLIIGVDCDKIRLLSGTFKWNVKISNIKRVWVTDKEAILVRQIEENRERKKERNERRDADKIIRKLKAGEYVLKKK